jgi:hypothetical protein
MGTMDHNELVERAGKWLKSFGCSVVFCELVAATKHGEIPDAIGWKSGGSILIECKVHRSDFLADQKKVFRQLPHLGMGVFRLYMCPEGLIQPDEVPEGWGLLWIRGKKVTRVIGPRGNYFPHDGAVAAHYKRSEASEIAMLVSAIRRNPPTKV